MKLIATITAEMEKEEGFRYYWHVQDEDATMTWQGGNIYPRCRSFTEAAVAAGKQMDKLIEFIEKIRKT